jgi:hypothetical protein
VANFRRISSIVLLAALSLPCAAPAQTPGPAASPDPAATPDLAAIAARGRFLADYDQAAWHGSDAGQAAAGNDTAGLDLFIARKIPTGWVVDFGALDAAGTSFLTVYEATGADTRHFTVQTFKPARADTGFVVAAAHAIKTAEANFQAVAGHTYNVAVMPNDDGTMYVYMYPAQISSIVPLGGDERFNVSADGTTLIDAHRMHDSILMLNASVPAGSTAVAAVHTDIHSDVPEDTDVFHVLASNPRLPEFVSARGHLYRIDIDGTITALPSKP